MTVPHITDEGFDELQRGLQRASRLALPLAERAIGVALTALESVMAPYPPQPDRDRANQDGEKPSPYNTYVRGIGHFPRSAFRQVEGVWQRKKTGAYKPGPKGGKVRRTSQQLDKRWRIRVVREGHAVVGTLENTASYSGYVIGHKAGVESNDGTPAQAPFHAETGWPNVDDSLAHVQPIIDQAFETVIDTFVTQLAGG